MTKPVTDSSAARSIAIGNLTIEDAGDCVTISGDLDIRCDLEGLRAAQALASQLIMVRDALLARQDSLPERETVKHKTFVENPLSP